MSEEVLQRATRDIFRRPTDTGGLGLKVADCDMTSGGKPAPRCGKVFYGIHQGGCNATQAGSLEEYHALDVTITIRLDGPMDRVGADKINDAELGLNRKLHELKTFMTRKQHVVMNAANDMLADDVSGFVEPLRFLGAGSPEERGAEWFASEDDSACGLSVTLHFGEAMRLHEISQAG